MTTKEEVQIYNAHVSINVKKLKEASKEDLFSLNSYFTRWAKNFGLDFPEAEDLNLFSNFTRKNYPSFNLIDIEECINLVTTDRLNLPKDIKPYGELSCMYISRVFNAYKEYKNIIISKVRTATEKLTMIEYKPSDEEKLRSFKEVLLLAKETTANKKFYYDSGNIIFDFIIFNKLVDLEKYKIKALAYGGRQFKLDAKKQIETAPSRLNAKAIEEINLTKDQKMYNYAKKYVSNQWIIATDIPTFIKTITIEMLTK